MVTAMDLGNSFVTGLLLMIPNTMELSNSFLPGAPLVILMQSVFMILNELASIYLTNLDPLFRTNAPGVP